MQPEGDGALAYTDLAQDEHLDLAANVAHLLATAGAAIGAYWGRDGAALANAASGVIAGTLDAAAQLRNA